MPEFNQHALTHFKLTPGASLPTSKPPVTLYQHPSGRIYVVSERPGQQVVFTPAETAFTPFLEREEEIHWGQERSRQDPIANGLILLAVSLGGSIVLAALIAALSRPQPQTQVVTIPSQPVCNTYKSSFLGFSQETKECN